MSDELFALIEAAEINQKNIQALIENSEKTTERTTSTAQAVIAKLDRLPTTITEQIRGEISGAVKAATAEFDSTARRMKTVATWWPIILPVVATVFLCTALFFFTENKRETVKELSTQITRQENTLSKLKGETWGLELVEYQDGTRGILLPKGVKVDRTGKIEDGRIGIVITP